MHTKLVTITLIFISFSAFTQTIPPDPDPGCNWIDRVGLILPNNQNTQYFVGGYNLNGNSGNCDGITSNVSFDQLNPGEFAYGMFDANLIYETTPEMVDFSFDLTNTLASLPIGQHVKIAELNSSNTLIADITLRKIANIAAVSSGSGKNSKIDPYLWQVIIKWYGSFTSIYTDESFVFTMNELVEYNYIFDDSDPNSPVSMISLGGNDISVNPYNLPTGGLATYSLGLIDISTTLNSGDGVIFDINWPDGNATE